VGRAGQDVHDAAVAGGEGVADGDVRQPVSVHVTRAGQGTIPVLRQDERRGRLTRPFPDDARAVLVDTVAHDLTSAGVDLRILVVAVRPVRDVPLGRPARHTGAGQSTNG
jgi:hypothetical protein